MQFHHIGIATNDIESLIEKLLNIKKLNFIEMGVRIRYDFNIINIFTILRYNLANLLFST